METTYLYLSVFQISTFSFLSIRFTAFHLSIDCVAKCINNSKAVSEQQRRRETKTRIEAAWLHCING
jgi:hypothetical protein